MAQLEIPFAAQEGESGAVQNSQERLINMFAEPEISGRKQIIRRQRAGLKQLLANAGSKRCVERRNNRHHCIIGNKLYRFDGVSLTQLGSIDTSSGRCTMIFDDLGEIMISDGTKGYYYNGSSVTPVTAPESVGHLAFIAGYGVTTVPNTGRFYVTPVNNFSQFQPLDFATAESYPDNTVRLFADHNELWVLGTRSVEVWRPSGSLDFPFSKFTQLERGCGAAFSVAAEDNTLFWLGDDWVVYRADGYRPMRVSTHPIERLIAAVSDDVKSQADAVIYTMGGHKFYTLRFPGHLTIQFNIATGFWNLAQTFGHNDWKITGSAGHNVDYVMTDAGICRLIDGLCTDEEGILYRGGISAPVHADGARIICRSLWLDAEMGHAPITTDANVMLRVARDGETFGNERWRSLGAMGEYGKRAVWRNLGMGRRMTFEFGITDPVPFSVMAIGADITAGR